MSATEPSHESTVPPAAEAVAAEAADTMTQTAETVADLAEDGVTAGADMAEQGATLAAEASQAAMDATVSTASETAKAFEAARDRLQTIASRGAAEGAEEFNRFRSSSEALNGKVADGLSRTGQHMAAFNTKVMEAWRTNAEATIAHWQSLVGVKSFSEAVSLNAAHVRKQMETMTAQTRELAELAGRIARDAGQPFGRS